MYVCMLDSDQAQINSVQKDKRLCRDPSRQIFLLIAKTSNKI
jgi:hypothetical protein